MPSKGRVRPAGRALRRLPKGRVRPAGRALRQRSHHLLSRRRRRGGHPATTTCRTSLVTSTRTGGTLRLTRSTSLSRQRDWANCRRSVVAMRAGGTHFSRPWTGPTASTSPWPSPTCQRTSTPWPFGSPRFVKNTIPICLLP